MDFLCFPHAIPYFYPCPSCLSSTPSSFPFSFPFTHSRTAANPFRFSATAVWPGSFVPSKSQTLTYIFRFACQPCFLSSPPTAILFHLHHTSTSYTLHWSPKAFGTILKYLYISTMPVQPPHPAPLPYPSYSPCALHLLLTFLWLSSQARKVCSDCSGDTCPRRGWAEWQALGCWPRDMHVSQESSASWQPAKRHDMAANKPFCGKHLFPLLINIV